VITAKVPTLSSRVVVGIAACMGLMAALAVPHASAAVSAATATAPAAPVVQPYEFSPGEVEQNRYDNTPNYGAGPTIDGSHSGSVGRDGSTSAGGFPGLTFRDQRTADGGNQFSVEPPDQGLCTSGLQVLEAVNTVFTVYSRDGQAQGPPQALNPFFYPGQHAIDRSATPPRFGAFISDPKCYFDPEILRYYLTVLEIDRDPVTGEFLGPSHVLIAVSKSPFATTDRQGWYFYSVTTTNAGPTAADPSAPSHPGCPCFGDQPLIGADAYGFFITTNEFPVFADGFNGAQVYAFDKRALARGTLRYQAVAGTPLLTFPSGDLAYTLQPATSPTASEWDRSNNGTEYLMSALDFGGQGDARVAAWAMTNTRSLQTPTPAVVLTPPTIVPTEPYVSPVPATQKPGPYPLGESLGDPEETLNTNDDRMQQVVYVNGNMWSGLNTTVITGGTQFAGIAYFVVRPRAVTPATVAATLVSQGYVTLANNNVLFPSIGVNSSGLAIMTFSYSGPDYYPSMGYSKIDIRRGPGPVVPIAPGTKPEDGFSGYPQFGGNQVARWGDYSAAVADTSGTIWLAAEYIPGTFGYPPFLGNWGTFVGRVDGGGNGDNGDNHGNGDNRGNGGDSHGNGSGGGDSSDHGHGGGRG
jgi:hypothetical protein